MEHFGNRQEYAPDVKALMDTIRFRLAQSVGENLNAPEISREEIQKRLDEILHSKLNNYLYSPVFDIQSYVVTHTVLVRCKRGVRIEEYMDNELIKPQRVRYYSARVAKKKKNRGIGTLVTTFNAQPIIPARRITVNLQVNKQPPHWLQRLLDA